MSMSNHFQIIPILIVVLQDACRGEEEKRGGGGEEEGGVFEQQAASGTFHKGNPLIFNCQNTDEFTQPVFGFTTMQKIFCLFFRW